MPGFSEQTNSFEAKAVGEHKIPIVPEDGGTINLHGIDGGLVEANSATEITWYLPENGDIPEGVSFYASNKLDGVIVIRRNSEDGGGILSTVQASNISQFVVASDGSWQSGGADSGDISYDPNLSGLGDDWTVSSWLQETDLSPYRVHKLTTNILSAVETDGTPLTVAGADIGFARRSSKNICIQIPAGAATTSFVIPIRVPHGLINNDLNNGQTFTYLIEKGSNLDTLQMNTTIYGITGSGLVYESTKTASGSIPESLGPHVASFTTDLADNSEFFELQAVCSLSAANTNDDIWIHGVQFRVFTGPL